MKLGLREIHRHVCDLVKGTEKLNGAGISPGKNFIYVLVHCYIEMLEKLIRDNRLEPPTILTMARQKRLEEDLEQLKKSSQYLEKNNK